MIKHHTVLFSKLCPFNRLLFKLKNIVYSMLYKLKPEYLKLFEHDSFDKVFPSQSVQNYNDNVRSYGPLKI